MDSAITRRAFALLVLALGCGAADVSIAQDWVTVSSDDAASEGCSCPRCSGQEPPADEEPGSDDPCEKADEEDEEDEEEQPWRLFDCCCLKRRKITLAGWLDQGFTWNPDSPADRFNGPNSYNDRANEYQLNELWLYAERLAENDGCGFAWGGRIDLMYGTDWRWMPAGGLEVFTDFQPRWNQEHRFYGLAMPQLYVETAFNNLSIKWGKYYSIVGYESVPATGNFFYSQSYVHQYGTPFTHTGFLATYKAGDRWTLYSGLHRGWDMWSDNNGKLGYIGGAKWTAPEDKSSLAYYVSTSPEDNLGTQNRFINCIVYTRQMTDRLDWVLEHVLGTQDDAAPGSADAEWYSINNYLFYELNDCWTAGARWEWFRDDDGFRVAPPGTIDPRIGETRGGFAGNFFDMSYGLNYKPNQNVIWRPEARWDFYDGEPNANGQQPYDDGTSDHQFTLGVDLIVTF